MLLRLQNVILEMVAKGEALKATTDRLCTEVEAIAPGTICSVLAVDRGGFLHPLSCPALPQSYSDAFEGLAIGPAVGSCGTAAYRGASVTVTDIETDPLWAAFRASAVPLGIKACWSSPIFNSEGRVIGTFAFYYRVHRGPNEFEEAIVATCAHLCTIAIERHERVLERERMAYSDALTGLPNRAKFELSLLAEASRQEGPRGLLLFDIDNLKAFNDTFGHRAADALIQIVASRIAATAMPHRSFRLSGDEFAVLVEHNDVAALAKKIMAAVSEAALCDGHSVMPSVTIGGAVLGIDRDCELMRHEADFALYHAKDNGRGRFVLHTPALKTAISHRFEAIHNVGVALDEGRIETFYQPIVRLDTSEIVGLEALCRMRTHSGSVVPAGDFHDATTDVRLGSRITQTMMSNVARDLRHWLDLGIPVQHVGINVSSSDFHRGDLGDRLTTTFGGVNVPLNHIILEVTESVYLGQRYTAIADEIRALRSKGLLVALDDFGTGFASLTHLLSVPIDIIKIDKSFVDGIAEGGGGAAIIKGVLGIAGDLGIRVVAEGVETPDQVRHLRALGCTLGQGYNFSKAAGRDATTELLLRFAQQPSTSTGKMVQLETYRQRVVH
jgi:diguanylate cyclase (GGDEF)-like protein